MCSEPSAYDAGSEKRHAAIASLFMGAANNGGLNSFLTSTWDFDAAEVKESLLAVGAYAAAKQLEAVLTGLAIPLPVMSQDARWAALDVAWTEELDGLDSLSSTSDDELMVVLERHVASNEAFYLELEAS